MVKIIFAKRNIQKILIGVIIIYGLIYSSFYNYLLFHTIVELFTIIIGFGVFILAWNTRRFSNNSYLLFIGISFFFISSIDLVHTLAYKGMNIFQGYDSNLPTQLWIAARYLQSISFLIAPIFLHRKLKPNVALIGFFLITAFLLASIFLAFFPDCYIEGSGLTGFKKTSEYIISFIFLLSTILLFKNRDEFDSKIFYHIIASLLLMVGGEIAFTFYISVFGASNLIGHIFKLFAFFLIYFAIIEIGLKKPFNLVFRQVDQNQKKLEKINKDLKNIIKERTKEIVKRKSAEEKLRLDNQMLANIIDSIVLYKVSDGKIVYTNLQFNKLFGYNSGELIGKHISILNIPAKRVTDEISKKISESLIKDGKWEGEIQNIKKDGNTFWSHASISGFTNDEYGEVWVSVQQDISIKKQAELQLIRFSTQDSQTGLYNRAFFDEEMKRLEQGRHFPVSIVIADVDGLKKINDTYGHASGDLLLQRAANVLVKSFRGEDIVARIGGDEFAVILPNTNEDAVQVVLNRIHHLLELSNKNDGDLRISIGVATCIEQGSLSNTFKLADDRMYLDKKSKS